MKILITGSRGFLGSHLIRGLRKRGHEIVPFDLMDGRSIGNLSQLLSSLDGVDVCYHLAAMADLYNAANNPLAAMNVNVAGTCRVAEACWRKGVLLNYVSTCCIYGNQDSFPITEKSPPRPTEIYAFTKLAGEESVRGYGTLGLRYKILRSATFYGPGMRAALAPWRFLKRAAEGQFLLLHGDGLQTRALTYVEDVAEGMALLAKTGMAGETYNIVTETEISALEMAETARRIVGTVSELRFVEDRPGQIRRQKFDNSKMRALGWQPEVSFEEGMKRTWEWMKEGKNE